MVNKRGTSEWHGAIRFGFVVAILVAVIGLWGLITGHFPWEIQEFTGLPSIKDAVDPGNLKSYELIFGKGFKWLDYIIGKVPEFLILNTIGGEVSAAIIMTGIWLMFFLIFADIAVLFSTFNSYIGWVIGFVLAVMAANLKITTYLAVYVTAFTAGFGVISVGLALVFMFILFLMFNFGVEGINEFLIARKNAEMELRVAMGSARAKAGLRTLKGLGDEAGKK